MIRSKKLKKSRGKHTHTYTRELIRLKVINSRVQMTIQIHQSAFPIEAKAHLHHKMTWRHYYKSLDTIKNTERFKFCWIWYEANGTKGCKCGWDHTQGTDKLLVGCGGGPTRESSKKDLSTNFVLWSIPRCTHTHTYIYTHTHTKRIRE